MRAQPPRPLIEDEAHYEQRKYASMTSNVPGWLAPKLGKASLSNAAATIAASSVSRPACREPSGLLAELTAVAAQQLALRRGRLLLRRRRPRLQRRELRRARRRHVPDGRARALARLGRLGRCAGRLRLRRL